MAVKVDLVRLGGREVAEYGCDAQLGEIGRRLC
eukprot:SAG22_NODE_13084_length_419_cov_1.328125_1_plen_32_part_01